MNYVKQFTIILILSFIGEVLHALVPLPIPASIYGIVLLFVALEREILHVTDIKDVAGFFIQILPLLFVPAGVGLMNSWTVLKPTLVPIAVITFVSTLLVLGVTGRVTQFVIRRDKQNLKQKKASYVLSEKEAQNNE